MARRDHEEQPETPEPADAGRAGRIVIAGEGAALETPDAMDGIDVGVEGVAVGAEEAAVHITDDPGAPVATEPSVARSPELDDPELEAALRDDPEADEAVDQALRDVAADGAVFDPGLPGGAAVEDVGEPGAARLDRAPESGGAAAGADGRQDVGPDSWR